jgi:hypothetical protein
MIRTVCKPLLLIVCTFVTDNLNTPFLRFAIVDCFLRNSKHNSLDKPNALILQVKVLKEYKNMYCTTNEIEDDE